MDFHIISWNVNGLRNSRIRGSRKMLLRQDLHRHVVGVVDLLMVQEHKVEAPFGNILPGGAVTFWEPSIGIRSRSGGVCISVGPRWVSAIEQHGTLVAGRAMYVTLRVDQVLVGFLCIYAPTHPRDRARFWSSIIDVLPIVDSWVIGGDFNNVETVDDWRADIAPALSSISHREQADWDRFLLRISGSDAWHIPSYGHLSGSLSYSWGFRRQQGRLLERLDRFYVGSWAASLGGTMAIWPGTVLSDHAPVSLRIQSQLSTAPRRGCRIPDRVLSAETLVEHIQHIWSVDASEFDCAALLLATCISESSTACRSFTLSESLRLQRRERALQVPLASTRRLMQEHPQDSYLAARQIELTEELQIVQMHRSEFSHRASISSWISKADRMNKDFFALHRERPAGSSLRTIRDDAGSLQTHPDIVMEVASDFYERLFSADEITDEVLSAREDIWSHTRQRVTHAMCLDLMAPFSFEELHDAVLSLDPSSCPGDDGLTREFFLQHWDVLHTQLWRGCQAIFSSGHMPSSLCSGLISLIPKGGDTTLLRQWRPITLLSSVYKILAKMISARLRPFLPELIHGSQTGFVQDRCILDNIFCFHQAVEWSRSTQQPLALLLLDFEKAYDRVDWSFLEGTLLRMGFPASWIRGVAALYRSSSSAVTIGGHVGRSFTLSRSVRQGCPLAPYLFLFVAETMSDFIRGQIPVFRGLHMPIAEEQDLVDQEYADDTLLYVLYSSGALDAIRRTLTTFCVASGARINWHKSYGILVASDDVPSWGVSDGFTWLAPGQSCRYLGFQVGIDISSAQQFSPVMLAIRKKLCHWSSRHLSLAGRALVANQVILASAWYIASCWMLHSDVISQLRRLIRNFLWGGSDGTRDTRARVRWSTIILSRSDGGLGIIDPEMQSRALLSKLIVRGLFPGNEPWKILMQASLATVVPQFGIRDLHSWSPGYRFIFTDAPLSQRQLSPFMRSLLVIWISMRRALIRREPRSLEEIERQPLIWNSHVCDAENRQLGERKHIDWAIWDKGPAASLHSWYENRLLDADLLGTMYDIGRGVQTRIQEIDDAIPLVWDQVLRGETQLPDHSGWWAFFDCQGSPVLVRYAHMLFTIADDQDSSPHIRIIFSEAFEERISLEVTWVPIRVVGSRGKDRRVDPFFSPDFAPSWRLWIWEGQPISQLYWDPGEWQWPHSDSSCAPVSFFEYSVRIGRIIQLRHQHHQPTRLRTWLHQGLSHAYLHQFWSAVWDLDISRRISYFLWMVAHAGLPVGTWVGAAGHDPNCSRCVQNAPESIRHCLWVCPPSHAVWRAVCLLLTRVGLHAGFITWGSVSWLMPLPGPHLFFEGVDADPAFLLTAAGYRLGSLDMIPTLAIQGDPQHRDIVFSTIVSITLWFVWKARCSHILGSGPPTTSDTLTGIWLELIYSLRSQWDRSSGSSRAAEKRRHGFIRRWSRSALFFSFRAGRIQWHYSPPQWFILHSSYQPP